MRDKQPSRDSVESLKDLNLEVTLLPGHYTVGVHEDTPVPGRYRVRPESGWVNFIVKDSDGDYKVSLAMSTDPDDDEAESFVFDLGAGDKIEIEKTVIFKPSK